MVSVSQLKQKAANKVPDVLNALLEVPPDTAWTAKGNHLDFPWKVQCDKGDYNDEGWYSGIAELEGHCKASIGYGYSLIYGQERNTRWQGRKRNLDEIVFDTPEDLLRFSDRYDDTLFLLSIAKEADNKLGQISIPDLHTGSSSDSRHWIAWLKSNKNTIMNPRYRDSGFWRGVIDLAAYLAVHPDSGCFPRELPVPVDTKFLETNHVLVIGLLCTLRPDLPVLFDKQLSWEHQLGLRKKEDMIQIRLPMPAQIMVANEVCTQTNHVIIPKEAFIAFSYPYIKKVFIIENETLFLTFPLEDGELALYKGGFAITALRGAPWLELCELYYFSDIDEHGFAMLSLMRGMYPKVQSFCMDIQTYEQFSEFKGTGKNYPGEYTGLTASELQVLEMLRVDGQHVRLEQEHVSLEYIKKRKQSLFNN